MAEISDPDPPAGVLLQKHITDRAKDKHYFQVPASMLSVTIGTHVISGGGDCTARNSLCSEDFTLLFT